MRRLRNLHVCKPSVLPPDNGVAKEKPATKDGSGQHEVAFLADGPQRFCWVLERRSDFLFAPGKSNRPTDRKCRCRENVVHWRGNSVEPDDNQNTSRPE